MKQTSNKQMHSKLTSWLIRHSQALFASLGQMWRAPLANLMTIMVIAIALALPAGLYILLQNVNIASQDWHQTAQISLFLKQDTGADDTQILIEKLRQNSDIAQVHYVSPQQGLQQLKQQADFSQVIEQLPQNPLPGVITLVPAQTLQSPWAIKDLLAQLKQLQHVDIAQLDMAWLKRLYAIINLAQRFVWGLGVLLSLGVILIVGNTIRLAIQNQKRAIQVTKLVGATDAFIRRPFLYVGLLYGFFGALIAFILVKLFLAWLSPALEDLMNLYQADFYLHGFSLLTTEIMFLGGMGLGSMGAWLAVKQQLKHIEPE
jgi:cell division transport system permease protein